MKSYPSVPYQRWYLPIPPLPPDAAQAFSAVERALQTFEEDAFPFDLLAQVSMLCAFVDLMHKDYPSAHAFVGWAFQEDRSTIHASCISPPVTVRQVRLLIELLKAGIANKVARH